MVWHHLRDNGFIKKYKVWEKHGEVAGCIDLVDQNVNINYMEDDMVRLVQEALGGGNRNANDHHDVEGNFSAACLGPNESTKNLLKLLEGASLPLYPGSTKHTALSFVVRLLQAKVLHGWSDNSFKTLLGILEESMPDETILPKSFYEAQKLVEDLGFSFYTIDACPNSCMLFRGDDINLDECRVCKASRWKEISGDAMGCAANVKRKATKQARYFPLKPRLQRLFMCSQTTKLMRWHGEERTNDGVFRHPADSLAWKDFDEKNTTFAADIRNVRLGLASDGFNPFRTRDIIHSTWPIILVPYNLPPLMCMKQPFIYLSVLIDGPKGPGDNIDVYMQPLIEELKELYEDGVETFDSFSNEMFQLRAALLWTINDFPAYANLSGWSTSGKYACPSCNSESGYERLIHGSKGSYMSHRRWLSYDHRYRSDPTAFNGSTEYRFKPRTLSGVERLAQMESDGVLTQYKIQDMERRHVIGVRRLKLELSKKQHNWRKKSILYELPYWKHNLLQHNKDVMHIEKNFADNVIFTILGVVGKSKDNLNSRRDLERMEIRRQYHLKRTESGQEYADPAEFEMNNKGKDLFLSGLAATRMPEGAASNIARRVNLRDRSIRSLKSHDNHIMLQQLIPLFIRSSLPANVVQPLIDVGNFFKQLCSLENSAADLQALRDRIVLTLCELEKIFPPSFFDIMEHLPVHLVDEALVAGAVIFRWMYHIERYLLTLKEYVRNRAYPEASIAKCYLMEECMNFCTQYLNDVESKFNRPLRKKDDDDDVNKGKDMVLEEITRVQAHRWILFHTEAVTPFLNEHLTAIQRDYPSADEQSVQQVHFREFAAWFKEHVRSLQRSSSVMLSDEIVDLSNSPMPTVKRFNSYKVNGFMFRVKSLDSHRTTQNSGVSLIQDNRESLPYYGRLTDIIKVTYSIDVKYVIFKCDWVNPRTGIKFDSFKFPLVNFKRLLYKNDRIGDEPFILASQAHQVWYAPDPSGKDWLNVARMPTRDLTHVQTKKNTWPSGSSPMEVDE
ncbi:uncharacterized protein LOC126802526 [Argentina anserina]|uniref:uncharacterized protein LOC126802526 n=1 Tax=Argentina anserina TaxID=57926 RepID=UPI0021768A2F|nr:uncharacterized protein LOC126802526 [Potentilla anserina]